MVHVNLQARALKPSTFAMCHHWRSVNVRACEAPLAGRPSISPCVFSSLDSDTEVCEVVKDSRVLSRPKASPELKFCQVPGVMPEIAKWILTKTRACRVFLVSLLCLARSRLLVTKVGERVC